MGTVEPDGQRVGESIATDDDVLDALDHLVEHMTDRYTSTGEAPALTADEAERVLARYDR
jgi:hypothetical protein